MSTAQIPLALRVGGAAGFADFLPADSAALAALRRWADPQQPAPDALLLQGPRASGKTHLLLAAAASLIEAGIEVAYLPLASLGEHAAALAQAQPAVPALLIDDLDRVEADAALQLALFGLHNRQRDGGGRLLYASRSAPLDWPQVLPDLRSRLGQCTRLQLPLLDEAQRRQWLALRARQLGFSLDEAAVDYVFRRVDRDLRSLNTLLDRLDQASLAAQRRITLPFLRQVIQAGVHEGGTD